ncbi:MAG: ATP-binding protein [Actinomycetota bacterium]|nr:ATP-binding protein [Actinomycetota bacterium]
MSICLSSRFPMLVWWGPQLTVFYNDAYLPLLGTKHPAALGRPASAVWAEAWNDLGPLAEQVLSGGDATFSQDQRLLLHRHGYLEETFWTFSYSPVPDENRVGGVFIAVTDTTSRVLGERRLRALRDLGDVSTASVGTLDEACRAAVAVLNGHRAPVPFAVAYLRTDDAGALRPVAWGGVVAGSPAAEGVLLGPEADAAVRRVAAGGPAEVVGGMRSGDRSWFVPGPAGDSVPDQAVVLPITVSGTAERVGVLVCGVNPYRELDADYRGFFDLVGGHVSTAVTDAAAYLAERRRAEALAELDRAKTDFFSNVSHEFRTPLTLIAGPVAELLASPAAAADPRLREELEVIERNAQRLGKLVNTLLDFSRIQAGRIDARFEPVDLAATTAELASVFRSAVVRAGLDFTVDCPPLDGPVHVDRDMWEKVVLNLLSNALKFTLAGGIAVRLRQDEGGARLTVSDTGTGIPADELPRLFERFHRVADARGRSGEGSGIGLAMVRELVGLHGGTIDVESVPDAGTTFTVTLPLGTAHLPADQLAEPAPDAPAVSPAAVPFVTEALRWLPDADGTAGADLASGGRRATAASGRVLVADDNADMRGYLLRLLGPHYDVRAVADGRQALDAALTDPPDLVVSDVMMPEMDGMGLLAALRTEPRTARVPVVLLSARAGEEAAVEGLAAGADDYLVKPFSAQELLARVGAHLQLGRARRAAEEQFTAMADLAPALIWVADAHGRRVFVNRGWTEFTGRSAREELGHGWEQGLHPEDRDRYAEVVDASSARREGWEIDVRLRRADGTYHWLLERVAPIGAGETFAGYVGSCTDINARTRETARQTLLAEVGTALDRETTVDGQLGALAHLLVERRLADLCSVRLLRDDGRLRFAGIAGLDRASEAALAGLDPHSGMSLDVLATGRPVLRAGLPWPDASLDTELGWPHSLLSAIAVPLSVRGRLLAVLALGRQTAAPPYDDDDRVLLEEIAGRAALAVDNAVLLAEERAAARRLALLQRATAELSAASTPLEVARVAGGHVRALTGPASRVAVYEVDPSHRALSALAIDGGSPAGMELWRTLPMSAPLVSTTAVAERRPV